MTKCYLYIIAIRHILQQQIAKFYIENKLNCQLPSAYILVLKESNGLSFTNGVFIYGTEEIVERNETWEVAEYAKGYIAIGDDSGGMIF